MTLPQPTHPALTGTGMIKWEQTISNTVHFDNPISDSNVVEVD